MFDTIEKHRGFFKILLVLIALSFVTFTAHSFSQAGGDYISKIGDSTISDHDLERVIRNNDLQADANVRKEVYQSLLQQAYLLNGAEEMGMSLSQEQIKKIIMAQPVFQENGVFNQQKFNEYLQRANQSEATLAEDLRKDFYVRNVFGLVSEGGMVADSQAESLIKVYHSTYDVQTVLFPLAKYTDKVQVDDAKVEAFYQKNQERYAQPLAVKFDYIRVSAADLAATQTVTDEEIAVVAPGAAASEAAAVRSRLKLEKAARTLPVVKENIADAAFNQSADLIAAAKEAGTPIQHHQEWLSREAAQKAGMPEAVVTTLFSDDVLNKRMNSDAIEADGTIWVVRVSDVRAEKAMALAEIKPKVTQDYITEQEHVLAKAAADEAYAKLQKGENIVLTWSPQEKITLGQAKVALPPEDYAKLMQAKPQGDKPAYVLYADLPTPMLMRVNAVSTPEYTSELLDITKVQLMQYNNGNAFQDYLRYLQRTVKNTQGRQKITEE